MDQNVKLRKKGEFVDRQKISEVGKAFESYFDVRTTGDKLELIKRISKGSQKRRLPRN